MEWESIPSRNGRLEIMSLGKNVGNEQSFSLEIPIVEHHSEECHTPTEPLVNSPRIHMTLNFILANKKLYF